MKKRLLTSIIALASVITLASCADTTTDPITGQTGPAGQNGQNGADGLNGVDGATWLFGSSDPSADLGAIGDLYLNTDTYDIYAKTESGWTLIGNIKGEDGLPGTDGDDGIDGLDGVDGTDGLDGATWLVGSTDPEDTIGEVGDLYLNDVTGDIFTKDESNNWRYIGNLKGDKGDTGEKGDEGLTAYSNTILPSENGYVTIDVGSALVGEEVTFTAYPDEGYVLSDLTIYNKGLAITLPEADITDGIPSYTLAMLEGGFVVQATFASAEEEGNSIYFEDGLLYVGGLVDGVGNVLIEGEATEIKFDSGTGTEADPLTLSTPEQFKQIAALQEAANSQGNANVSPDFSDLHFEQTADLVLTLSDRLSGFAGYYDGNDHSISFEEDLTWNGAATIFGNFYGGKVASISNLELGVREHQAVSLYNDSNWELDDGTYVTEVYVSGLTVTSLDGEPVRVNLNNYGFITNNPVGYYGNVLTHQKYEFRDITVNASIMNEGTSTGALIGSGILYDCYDSLVFEDILVNGTITGTTNVGLLWGNSAYTNPANLDPSGEHGPESMISAEDLTVNNVKLNGALIGLLGNETNVCLTPGNPDLLTAEQIASILGDSTISTSENNVLADVTGIMRYDLERGSLIIQKPELEGLEDYTVYPYINVSQINWGNGNYSNGVKTVIDDVLEFASDEDYTDFTKYGAFSRIYAVDSVTVKSASTAGLSRGTLTEEQLATIDYKYTFNTFKAGLYYDATYDELYVIFDMDDAANSSIDTVDCAATWGFYCYDANNNLIGMK